MSNEKFDKYQMSEVKLVNGLFGGQQDEPYCHVKTDSSKTTVNPWGALLGGDVGDTYEDYDSVPYCG